MIEPIKAGVTQAQWQEETSSCFEVGVRGVVEETHDARSILLEISEALRERFSYQPGQFLSFKFPFEGKVLTRSYSLASSPHTDRIHKVTVKRIGDGRISNWINDRVQVGSRLAVVPPAGLFVLNESDRNIVFFGGGSGITPIMSILKSALATSRRTLKLIYANRDERSIIFKKELDDLVSAHGDRLEVIHSIDDVDGFMDRSTMKRYALADLHADFYLCGPGAFMAAVGESLREAEVDHDQIHIERFVSPPDPGLSVEEVAPKITGDAVPEMITVVLDGNSHDVPYKKGEKILVAARSAGLDPPFSCEQGYCSCCMAKLMSGEVQMAANDCLGSDLLDEGWVLTCQSRCVSGRVKVEYPD